MFTNGRSPKRLTLTELRKQWVRYSQEYRTALPTNKHRWLEKMDAVADEYNRRLINLETVGIHVVRPKETSSDSP